MRYLIGLLIVCTFVGCASVPSQNLEPALAQQQIIGVWKSEKFAGVGGDKFDFEQFTFRSDGTMYEHVRYKNGGEGEWEGTYTIKDDHIVLLHQNERHKASVKFHLDGDTLLILRRAPWGGWNVRAQFKRVEQAA